MTAPDLELVDAANQLTDALVTLYREQTDSDVDVHDGAPDVDPEDMGLDSVIVGTTYGDQLAVTGTREHQSGWDARDVESFTIGIVITVIRPPGEAKAARDRVAELKAIAAQGLTDLTFAGMDMARLGSSFSTSTFKVLYNDSAMVEVDHRFEVYGRKLL